MQIIVLNMMIKQVYALTAKKNTSALMVSVHKLFQLLHNSQLKIYHQFMIQIAHYGRADYKYAWTAIVYHFTIS